MHLLLSMNTHLQGTDGEVGLPGEKGDTGPQGIKGQPVSCGYWTTCTVYAKIMYDDCIYMYRVHLDQMGHLVLLVFLGQKVHLDSL